MKGTVLVCFRELVVSKGGECAWLESLKSAGFDPYVIFTLNEEVDDHATARLIECIAITLKISLAELGDAFGYYWVHVFSPRIYQTMYQRHSSAREFILDINTAQSKFVLKGREQEAPFSKFNWVDSKKLVMEYHGVRGYLELVVGFIKAVGSYYDEKLEVTKVSPVHMQVIFR